MIERLYLVPSTSHPVVALQHIPEQRGPISQRIWVIRIFRGIEPITLLVDALVIESQKDDRDHTHDHETELKRVAEDVFRGVL